MKIIIKTLDGKEISFENKRTVDDSFKAVIQIQYGKTLIEIAADEMIESVKALDAIVVRDFSEEEVNLCQH